jgi:hypothetical protein
MRNPEYPLHALKLLDARIVVVDLCEDHDVAIMMKILRLKKEKSNMVLGQKPSASK